MLLESYIHANIRRRAGESKIRSSAFGTKSFGEKPRLNYVTVPENSASSLKQNRTLTSNIHYYLRRSTNSSFSYKDALKNTFIEFP